MKKSWYGQFCVAASIGALAVSADAVVNIQNIGAGERLLQRPKFSAHAFFLAIEFHD